MKNVSNEFKNIIKTGGPFYAYAVVTLKNGEKLTLDSDNDFYISGNGYVEDGGDGFPLGSALSKSITLVVDNLDERYSKNDFYYARITLFTESDMDNRTFDAWRDIKGDKILDVRGDEILLMKSRIERINEGTFTVLEPSAVGDTIELVGYDDMYKSDKEFKSKLSYPTTAGQLLREACSACDLMLGSPTFQNQDFVINAIPEKVTCREIIGYIAMIAVGNAVIQNGTLVIKSYDFSPIKTLAVANELIEDAGYHILRDFQSDPTIGTDPIQITGISTSKKVENDTTILLKGTDDYAIDITNPLIEGNEDEALNLIGKVLIGTNMRSFSGEFSPDPTIEFMDMVCILDRKDKVYPSFVTAHNFDYLGNSSVSCSVKDPERQKSTYYSEATKVYEKANKEIQKNKTDFETAVENLNKTLETSTGMYSTEEVQPDESIITYIHDKPVKDKSKNVIKVTSEAIGISNDGGKTYPYGIFLTGDLITRILYAIGINANYINAGSFTVKDKNGNITFYADTETGRVTINAESVTITGKSVEDISNEIVNNFVDTVYKSDMDIIKSEVKNKIETWYQDTDPSVDWGVTVEKTWCDIDGTPILDINGNEITILFEELKSKHEGDLWKNSTTNDEYIYRSGHWVKLQVPDEVFDEIDGKAQVFINTPVPPYRVGDLWTQGSTGDLMRCKTARASGNYNSSDWVLATKYTDDTVANKAMADIEVLKDKIKLKVSSEDVESIIEQKADSIRMQAKSISWKSEGSSMSPTGYLKCSGAEIDGTIRSTNILRTVYMTAGYNQYWYETNKVGLIGTNGFADTNFAIRGLNFDLDDGGHYMTWASKDTPSSTSYAMKMTYARKAFSSFTADSVNMGCNIDMHNYKLLNAKFGDGGITGTMNFVQRFKESDGTKQDYSGCYMTFKNGILVKAAWHS